jgi:cell division protein FtsL
MLYTHKAACTEPLPYDSTRTVMYSSNLWQLILYVSILCVIMILLVLLTFNTRFVQNSITKLVHDKADNDQLRAQCEELKSEVHMRASECA